MKKKHNLIELFLVLMLLAAIAPTYADDNGQPKIHGKTYGEWSAKWWQWLRSIPAQSNPLLGSGQVDCSIEQSGPVVFLAGTTGGDPVVRECSVPKGKELFFSPLNAMYYNDPADPLPHPNVAEKRIALDGFLSSACNLNITVDGEKLLFSAVAIARTQSPTFRINIGDDDVFGGTAGAIDNKVVSDGFWVMLRMPKGTHTLHVQGAACDPPGMPFFEQDYKYILHVE